METTFQRKLYIFFFMFVSQMTTDMFHLSQILFGPSLIYCLYPVVNRLKLQVSPMIQELVTIPEYLSSHRVFGGGCVTRSIVLCVYFVDRCQFLFILVIMLSVVFLFTDYDNPTHIFKPFFLRTHLNHESTKFLITAYVNV